MSVWLGGCHVAEAPLNTCQAASPCLLCHTSAAMGVFSITSHNINAASSCTESRSRANPFHLPINCGQAVRLLPQREGPPARRTSPGPSPGCTPSPRVSESPARAKERHTPGRHAPVRQPQRAPLGLSPIHPPEGGEDHGPPRWTRGLFEGLRVWLSWNGRPGCSHRSCAKLLKDEGGARGSRRGGGTGHGRKRRVGPPLPPLAGRMFTATWPLAHPDNTPCDPHRGDGASGGASTPFVRWPSVCGSVAWRVASQY